MKKIVLNVNKFDKNFKTITKIEMRKTSSLSKLLYKKDVKQNPLMKVEA
jgi:hypothetical protein